MGIFSTLLHKIIGGSSTDAHAEEIKSNQETISNGVTSDSDTIPTAVNKTTGVTNNMSQVDVTTKLDNLAKQSNEN